MRSGLPRPRVVGGYPRVVAADAKIQKLSIDTIRALAMDAVQKANAGHPGTAMALAPLAYVSTGACCGTTRPTGLGEPRPLRPLGRPRGDAPVRRPAPDRLQPLARGAEAVPPVAVEDAGAPGALRHGGRRDDDGAARPGFANGVGFAIADRFLAERYNRPHEIVDRFVYAICSTAT